MVRSTLTNRNSRLFPGIVALVQNPQVGPLGESCREVLVTTGGGAWWVAKERYKRTKKNLSHLITLYRYILVGVWFSISLGTTILPPTVK